MSKFTIFTIILSVSVITVTADLVARDYFAKTGQANVFSYDEASDTSSDSSSDSSTDTAPTPPPTPPPAPAPVPAPVGPQTAPSPVTAPAATTTPPPASDTPPTSGVSAPAALLTTALFTQAGFTAEAKEVHFNGKVYQLLDISKNPVVGITMYELSDPADSSKVVVSFTEVDLQDEIRALQLYMLLQNKTKPYIDLSLNETNAYGDRSFYINHDKKTDQAFLTVKIGPRIYAIAYIKAFHPQVKSLLQLLTDQKS